MVLDLDPDIPKISRSRSSTNVYRRAENKVSRSRRSKVRTKARRRDSLFFYCDLDLDPMTLIYELDLDLPEMHLLPNNKFLDNGLQDYSPDRHRQTDTI